jgi:hypothetical protein
MENVHPQTSISYTICNLFKVRDPEHEVPELTFPTSERYLLQVVPKRRYGIITTLRTVLEERRSVVSALQYVRAYGTEHMKKSMAQGSRYDTTVVNNNTQPLLTIQTVCSYVTCATYLE